MDKEKRQNEERIEQMIVDGHRRGVCDSEGRHVKDGHGRPVAKPRILGPRSVIKKHKSCD